MLNLFYFVLFITLLENKKQLDVCRRQRMASAAASLSLTLEKNSLPAPQLLIKKTNGGAHLMQSGKEDGAIVVSIII